MKLVIDNIVITAPIKTILQKLKEDIPQTLLDYIGDEKNNNIAITCPFHHNGHESHPSCFVYCSEDNDSLEKGYFRCFTCSEQGHLYDLVAYCFHSTVEYAKQWLVDNFGDVFLIDRPFLSDFIDAKDNNKFLDESILDQYAYYHPYLNTRHINSETARTFKVGYDKETDSVTFPIWDEFGRLLGVTKRSVNTKHFFIPKNIDKPIYLLNYIIKNHITTVYVVESQIDCLNLWEWGFPSIALLGCGSEKQYDILKHSGIRNYHLCLDGDSAGEHGCYRFKNAMPNDVLIDRVCIPDGKDINDLTREEFLNLPIKFS